MLKFGVKKLGGGVSRTLWCGECDNIDVSGIRFRVCNGSEIHFRFIDKEGKKFYSRYYFSSIRELGIDSGYGTEWGLVIKKI